MLLFTYNFQTMKNVRCKKLIIDRSKAPSKMGTFKDISLFGNFKFPSNGSYASGITAQSIAGRGTCVSKTKLQVQTLSSRNVRVAGATGASVTEEMWRPSDETVEGQGTTETESYAVKYIQLASATLGAAVLRPCNLSAAHTDLRPTAGFALKKGGAKRTTFTQAQKDIMIAFYDRQKSSQIRANPSDVIEAMNAAGVPVLKESQIKSWWSTYHRKQKQLADDMIEEARQLMLQQPGNHRGICYIYLVVRHIETMFPYVFQK